ncbi:MAG TPA: hypothetical protein VHU14_06670 [Solirubrobacterales bacterium]|jgi:hypothetical protein|nr:hypothetical protein [Solirubrobacterales bacterium]
MRESPPTKRCPRCGLAFTPADFAIDRSKASGDKSHCKDCDRRRFRSYYPANRERVLERVKRRAEVVAGKPN